MFGTVVTFRAKCCSNAASMQGDMNCRSLWNPGVMFGTGLLDCVEEVESELSPLVFGGMISVMSFSGLFTIFSFVLRAHTHSFAYTFDIHSCIPTYAYI